MPAWLNIVQGCNLSYLPHLHNLKRKDGTCASRQSCGEHAIHWAMLRRSAAFQQFSLTLGWYPGKAHLQCCRTGLRHCRRWRTRRQAACPGACGRWAWAGSLNWPQTPCRPHPQKRQWMRAHMMLQPLCRLLSQRNPPATLPPANLCTILRISPHARV